ncbi:helix-turn-helix domain containing protein [Mucilaginibacter flavidus]|uniref:helix-turn-helix domain containing protein n=1 Tax=Mucilaginibacter flavidus TaxID=2949309 RepID=UPI002093666A|nr:helix-turn-helix domain containing protein [Mucilaginibacter flavidus]MCO5946734.1 helix-turn-helix domain containing protein [Mucilaginibacter flavidus]
MGVEIGSIIHGFVHEKGLKAKFVAEYVNVSESTLYDIYKRDSVDIDKLILFSKLLNKNLFLYYLSEEPLKSMFSKDIVTLQNRIIELETESNANGEKLKYLSDIIETQKKVISLHEEKTSIKKLTIKKKK